MSKQDLYTDLEGKRLGDQETPGSDLNLLQYFWPHPYPQSHPPIQVTFSNGLPENDNDPVHKVFVLPYSMLEYVIYALLASERERLGGEK